MTFSAMIPYVVYGIRKCGLSSRIGNICSLHGAATGSPLSESRGRSDAPQRLGPRASYVPAIRPGPGACREVAVCARPRSCARHQEALVVAWQPLPVADHQMLPAIIEPIQASPCHARNRSTRRDCKVPVSACPPGVERNCDPRVCRSDLLPPARPSRWAIARTTRRGLCVWQPHKYFLPYLGTHAANTLLHAAALHGPSLDYACRDACSNPCSAVGRMRGVPPAAQPQPRGLSIPRPRPGGPAAYRLHPALGQPLARGVRAAPARGGAVVGRKGRLIFLYSPWRAIFLRHEYFRN